MPKNDLVRAKVKKTDSRKQRKIKKLVAKYLSQKLEEDLENIMSNALTSFLERPEPKKLSNKRFNLLRFDEDIT